MYLFSLAASTAVLIWAPYCTTSGPYLANKILQGLFGSPVEVLCETSMVDLVSLLSSQILSKTDISRVVCS